MFNAVICSFALAARRVLLKKCDTIDCRWYVDRKKRLRDNNGNGDLSRQGIFEGQQFSYVKAPLYFEGVE